MGVVNITTGTEAARTLTGKLDHQEHFNHQQHGVENDESRSEP